MKQIFKENEVEREQNFSPTMEEMGKMLAGYGGMYYLYRERDGDDEKAQVMGECIRNTLEDYVERCISLFESPKERICLRGIWNTEKKMLDEKSLEIMLKTQKIFCDGSGKELKEDVIRLLITYLPDKDKEKYTLLWKAYKGGLKKK